MFQLNLDVLISDTTDALPVKDAMTRPLESVLRAFGDALNTQIREYHERVLYLFCTSCGLPCDDTDDLGPCSCGSEEWVEGELPDAPDAGT